MKNLITYLKALWGAWGNLQSSDVRHDCRLTVGSPSGLDAKMKQKSKMLRYAVVVLFVLTLGAGNVWGTTPTLDDLEFSTSNSVRIVNEDFNSLNTVTKTASVAVTKTDQTEYGVFNCIYNNNTSNSYNIVNNANGFSDKSLSLLAGSGSPLIAHITGKSWGAKGAFRIKTTKTSTEYIGFYGETSGTIYAKAKSTVYLSVASGSVGIHNGGTGKSDGFVNVGSYSTDIIDICVIYNTTNSATTYGDNISLAANKAHVYINGTCVMDGASPKAFAIAQTTLTSFRVAPQASSGNKAYVDDVQIWNALPGAAASCTAPSATSNGSINQTSAEVSWTDGANASNGYYVAYSSSSSTTPGDITSSNATYTVHTISSGTKSDEFTSLTCGTTYHWWVRSNCGGSTSAWVAGTDITTSACTTPAITVSPSSLTNLNYIVGDGPSAAQNITLGGSYLTGNLTVTAPTNFEVSIDGGSTYGDSKSVTVTSGSPTVSTIKVRLKSGLSVGSYGSASTYVTVSGGSATTQNVSVTGSVLKPTITASPTSITGWNAETGSAPSPSTKTVSVTGVNLKANISASLTSGGDYFTITPASITQTSGSASGSITIGVKAAAYASAATRNGNLRLTTTDGDNVDVPITLVVADDPREKFTKLTNVNQLSDGAKIILVYKDLLGDFSIMSTTFEDQKGFGETTSGFEMLSSNTIVALSAVNSIQVLELKEQSSGVYGLYDGSNYIAHYTSGNKMTKVSFGEGLPDRALWTFAVYNDGTTGIWTEETTSYAIGRNGGTDPPYRCYTGDTYLTFTAYYQASTTPTVSLTSVSKMDYDYGSGPSDPQTATLSGKNLTANLTVTAPTNFEVRKGTTGDYSGSITITSSEALAGQTIQIRLKGNLGVNTYAGNLSVSGTDLDAAKTFALSGEVNCLSYAAGPVLGAVTAVNDHATITWSAVAGASEYEVKLGTGEWTDANGSLSHEFTSLTCGGTSYTYYVRAKAATGYCDASAATSSSFTTGECLCSNFSFHWGNSSSNTTTNWSSMNFRCFTQVGSSHEWQIENFVIGNTTDMNKFAVGWQNTAQDNLAYGSRTAVVTLESELFFAGTQSCGDGKRPTVRYGAKTAEGAIGTLRMYDNHDNHHDWNNCYVGFIPNGYGLMYGGSTATGNSLAMHATGNTNEWETEIAVLTQDMLLTNNTYKYQVGLLTNSGTYVDCGNSNPDNFGSMGSFYSSDWRGNVSTYSAGQAGKFQIWTGDCDGNVNWRCHFVPYYTINYYDLDDELIATDYVAYGTANTTLRTVSGHGWKNVSTGDRSESGSVTNAFGSSLTLSTSQPAGTYDFYLVAPGYTVTFSTPACVATPSPITSNSVTLPAEPATTPDGYTFAGWTTASIAGTTTSEPTLYAAGSTYNPASATTLYACYYSGDGAGSNVTFNVMKNSASIVAGYYVITANRSGSANALYNTVYNNTKLNSVTVDGSGASSTMSPSEQGAVWQFIADGEYWQIKNFANGKYLAAINDSYTNRIELVNSVSNDYARWKILLLQGDNNADTHVIYNKGKGESLISGSNYNRWYLHQYTTSSTPVWAANEIASNNTSGNGANLYFFNVTSTPNFSVTYNYTTNPTCKFNVAVSDVADVIIKATPSGGSDITEGNNANVTQGTTVTLNYSSLDPCYDFTTWTVTKVGGGAVSVTGASGNNATFTMPSDDDVIVTATITAKTTRTITYTIPSGGGSAVSPTTSVCDGGTVTLPNVTGISSEYSCETFRGWTTTAPDGSGTWASSPSYKAAGATSDAINSNTTFYAVYSRSGGGASGTVTLDAAAVAAVGTAGGRGYDDAASTITAADGSEWTVKCYVGNTQDYLQLKQGAAYYIKTPTCAGNIRTLTINYKETSGARNIIFGGTAGATTATTSVPAATSPYVFTDKVWDVSAANLSSGYLGFNENSGTFQVKSITLAYGPAPIISHTLECGCEIDEFDLTYDANTTNFPGSTTSCEGVTDYVFAEHDDKYTICSTEPTLAGYKFTGWTTSANGSGDHFDAGQEISCVPETPLTLYARYERVYTVTFNNQGVTTPVTQASEGATIAVPSATSPCSAEWAFVGWSETAIAPMSFLPSIEIASGTSIYTPTADKTLYAIYRKTSESSPFVAGMSGAYKIKATVSATDYYAGAINGAKLNSETTVGNAVTYYIKYTSADGGKYTIQRADGKYIAYKGNQPSGANTDIKISDDAFFWRISSAGGGLWAIQSPTSTDANTRYLQLSDGTGFKAYTTDVNPTFVAAEGQYYYRTMSCATEYDITFHNNGTTINWADGHPEASYKDLADATVVSTFPTATFDGWTFLGWRTTDYEESTTAPSASGIYSTGGNALTISSADVDLYPVFTRFEDNEPFDQINGGDYYIYYLKSSTDAYGAYERVYACSYADSKRYNQTTSCASATEFTFTKEGDIWHIYDKATGKYVAGVSGDNDLVHKSDLSGDYDDWTIEVVSGNQFEASCQGGTRRLSFSTSANYFMNYETAAGPGYLPVYLGSCTERTFTTNPSITPNIEIHGEVKVTSTATKSVKAKTALTVSASNISTANLTVTSDNSAFKFSLTSNGTYTASVNIPVVSNKVGVTPIYMEYTPTATSDGIEGAIVTVSDGAGTPTSVSTTAGDVQGRHLPAQFVIAARAGNEWVALTAKISKMSTQDAIPIKVDNTTTPTKASVALNTCEYSLLGLPNTNSRYATNGTAVHLYSNQTSKVLNATKSTSIKTAINTGANATNAANSDSCLFYEWKLLSEDLVHYTVTNSNTLAGLASNRVLGYSTGSGKWGMYTSANANQDIFLLPIDEVLTDLDLEVMEWSTTGMALRFGGAAPSSIKVTLGGETSAAKSLTNLSSSDIYTVSGLDLTTNNCEVMQITDGSDPSKGTLVRKPILVSSAVNGSAYTTSPGRDICENCDIIILSNGKLTANENKASNDHVNFANIYIYPGGKLVLDAQSLGVKQQVYVRGGYSWLNTSTYALPELYLNGNINFNGSSGIIYDYYIQPYKYYQCALPYNSELAKITDEAGVDDFPSWLKHYDGSLRAANASATSWAWYNGDVVETKTVIPAGKGFIIAARPRQVTKVMNRPLAIIRFPLGNSAYNGAGEAEKSVSTTAHGIAGYNAGTVTANNVGWNLIGNPYMATWKGDIGHKQLEKDPDAEHWNGSYHWADAATKYITVMEPEDGTDYDQYVASTKELKPFFPFFFQETAGGGSGTVTFTLGNRMKKAPAYMRAGSEVREAFVQIDYTNGVSQDQTGVYVGNKYSDDLDFDDYEKMFGSQTTKPKVWLMHESTRMAFEAMSEERAAGSVPMGYRAPETDEFTFSISEYSNLENVESVLLDDNEAGIYNFNLLNSDYTFSSENVLFNDTRFVIRIVMKDENTGGTTGTENIDLRSEETQKFIYHDKMYILRNGVLYDATGKRVKEINK